MNIELFFIFICNYFFLYKNNISQLNSKKKGIKIKMTKVSVEMT